MKPSNICAKPGANQGFARGGFEFSKKNSKNCRHFFVDQIDFPSSPKAVKRLCCGQTVCAAGKILKKYRPKKAVLGSF